QPRQDLAHSLRRPLDRLRLDAPQVPTRWISDHLFFLLSVLMLRRQRRLIQAPLQPSRKGDSPHFFAQAHELNSRVKGRERGAENCRAAAVPADPWNGKRERLSYKSVIGSRQSLASFPALGG